MVFVLSDFQTKGVIHVTGGTVVNTDYVSLASMLSLLMLPVFFWMLGAPPKKSFWNG